MTRDEAVERLCRDKVAGSHGALLDGLVSLGLLKLDEPKEPMDIVWDAFGPHNTATLQGILACNGLKVVRA